MALRWVPERGDKGIGIDMLGKICDALGISIQDFLTMTSNNSFFEGHRAELLKLREQASRHNARLNSGDVRKRANILKERLQMWLEGPKLEALNTLLSPVVLGRRYAPCTLSAPAVPARAGFWGDEYELRLI